MKKCPFCAEKIQEEAIACENCGRFLNAQKPPIKRKPAGRNALFGVGLLVFGFVLIGMTKGVKPTTKMEAMLPGLISASMHVAGIILIIVSIIQAIINRMAKGGIIE